MNHKYNLSFINDNELLACAEELLHSLDAKASIKSSPKSIFCPLSLTLAKSILQCDETDIVNAEVINQINNANRTFMPALHKNILGHAPNGWEASPLPNDGWDIENQTRNLFAHLVVSSDSLNSDESMTIHYRMRGLLAGNKKAKCYLVETSEAMNLDAPWLLTGRALTSDFQTRLRRISIDRFYAIVTDEDNAYERLCISLEQAIINVMSKSKRHPVGHFCIR